MNTRSGLPIRQTEMNVISEIQKIHQDELNGKNDGLAFFGGMYSHFTVLLEDVVCLFGIYVNQSGNKGLPIAQTARGNQLAC